MLLRRLLRQKEMLDQAERAIGETEAIAVGTVGELSKNRDTILSAQKKVNFYWDTFN